MPARQRPITNPVWRYLAYFFIVCSSGLKMIVAYDLLRISSGSSNLASQGVRSNTLVYASERLPKDGQVSLASMGTFAMPAMLSVTSCPGSSIREFSAYALVTLCSQRHLALNGGGPHGRYM